MDYHLKPISRAAIPEATARVAFYRSLNEPEEAESICRDILAIEPDHQLTLRLLGLAITDQFLGIAADRHHEAEDVFQRLADPYERHYYCGLLYERRAKAQLRVGQPPHTLLPLLERALACYAEAEKIRPPANDDALLRWNYCVRLLQSPALAWAEEFASLDSSDVPPS